MKPIHDGTLVLNKVATGFDPVNYPRIDSNGTELPGHGVYILGEDWIAVLEQRDSLLADVDKVLEGKISKKKREIFITYRKKLENIEQDFDDPQNVTWPDYPKK